MKIKIILILGIILVSLLAGCTTTQTHTYDVTEKLEPNILILDDFKEVQVSNVTYQKIDIGDRVQVDDSSNKIVSITTKEEIKEEEGMCLFGLMILLIILVWVIMFVGMVFINDAWDIDIFPYGFFIISITLTLLIVFIFI